MRTSLVSAAIAFIAGILLGRGFLFFPLLIAVLIIVSLALFLAAVLGKRVAARPGMIAALSCAAGVLLYLYSSAYVPRDHYTRRFTFDNETLECAGRISSTLNRDPGRTAFVLELSEIDGNRITGSVRVSLKEELSSFGYGDRVRIRGKLRHPGSFRNPNGYDYADYLARDGIHAVISPGKRDAVVLIERGSGAFRTIQDWRERIRQAFAASISGDGSAILQSMVLGETGALTDELRDRFQAAGVSHVISIDGSHLGMVALLCFGFFRWLLFLLPEKLYLRLTLFAEPKKIAALFSLPLVLFYTLLAGSQTPTVRSFIMIVMGLFALLLDRKHALVHSLAIAAFAILAAGSQALFDISFQLSFLCVLIIGYVVSLWNEFAVRPIGRIGKLAQSIALLMIISLATSLATGPLVAFYFNQFSLAGLVANLFVVPFAGAVVVPLGLFSGIVSLFTGHLPLAGLNQFAANVFVGMVSFFSRLPFASFHPPAPGVVWLICFAVFLISALHALRLFLIARFKPLEGSVRVPILSKITIAASGVLLLLALVHSFLPRQYASITFLDVGQGDCSLIELPSGKTVLIDGGGTIDNRFDIGRRVVAPFLWDRGIKRLDLVILSHPHPDHLNGLLFVLEKFPASEAWTSGLDTDLPAYDAFAKIVTERKIPLRIVSAADPPLSFGGTELSVLHPDPGFKSKSRKAYDAENNRSLVIRMASAGRTALFTGDIGTVVEKGLVERGADISCDVIKVPHHGSKTSSSEDFLARTHPSLAIASAGQGNSFHHPSPVVAERYEQSGVRFCRTDRDGAVIVTIRKDGAYRVVPWAEMLLEKISMDSWDGWGAIEKKNWKRLWERMGM